MNAEMNFSEPILPPTASSKHQLILSLTAIGMGLAAAAFLLTRPRIHASVPKAGCGTCGTSEAAATTAASGVCEMHAAPSNPTDATTNVNHSGVPHE